MSTLIAEAEVNRAHLESSAGILGQQQQLEEAARKQVQPSNHHFKSQAFVESE